MPIKIPADLPARLALENENIFVMTEDRASRQDIRPLEIAIVNLMPTKIATETQILRLLGNTPIQLNITLLRTATHTSQHTSQKHLDRFYKTFEQISHRAFDGMIITGAPVERLKFEDVDYWDELKTIMEYTRNRVYSTLYLCWAAQAGLYHFYGLPKYDLPQKISGIFSHNIFSSQCRLFRGFDDSFLAPHSRHTEILYEDAIKIPELRILASSPEAGLTMLESQDQRQVFMTGHLEYDRDTLAQEYERDLGKGLNPDIPSHYFPNDNPDATPVMNWKAHAHLFFSNWLNYYVYQETPFSLKAIHAKCLKRP